MNEFDFSSYHNVHCRFVLSDDSIVTGVVFLFSFNRETPKYYFVRTADLLEFRDAQLIGDLERCQTLARNSPLSSIKKADRID